MRLLEKHLLTRQSVLNICSTINLQSVRYSVINISVQKTKQRQMFTQKQIQIFKE